MIDDRITKKSRSVYEQEATATAADKPAHRNEDDETMRDVWIAIREAQDKATLALQQIALHERECSGRQQLVGLKLNLILWLLTVISSVGATALGAFIVQSFKVIIK